MNDARQNTLLDQAREAARQSEWQHAYDLLSEVDAEAPLNVTDLALLADAAYGAGRLDVTIDAWERAYAQSLSAGDQLAAADAAVRVALHMLIDTALMAPVRGWVKRAERLLEGHAETATHAWLSVVRNYERLLSGDYQSAQRWARQAIEIGTKHDPAAAAMGRVAEARGLALNGNMAEGLELLNEAAVAAVSGELDPLSTGILYCELVCTLQALAQYDLAEEWTAAMERWCRGQPIGSTHGRCRVHRAEILRLRGSYLEAENEALLACEELRPYLRRELGWPLTELGRIRLRRGDIDGAEEALLIAHELGWDPQPGLALVQLARGDVALAAASIRDALDHPPNIPSKEFPPNTEFRRAPLLEAQVEIEVQAGDLELAGAAADELTCIAELFGSQAFAAGAALARGRVRLAKGDAAGARGEFDEAALRWNEIGAPYETATARMGLGQAYRAMGNEERALQEFQIAQQIFERVGAVHLAPEASKASGAAGGDDRQVRKQSSQTETAKRPRGAQENVFRRQGDYWLVCFEGRTVHLRDVKGLRYLALLLSNPGREFHVLDLVSRERGGLAVTSRGAERFLAFTSASDAGVLIDTQAKEAYRRRLVEIEEDIEEARTMGDDERAAQAAAERDFLVSELARAVGLGGRDRRAGSASERARASVTRAIRQAMTRIHEHDPALGKHLDYTIRTGTYCAYQPDPRLPVVWKL